MIVSVFALILLCSQPDFAYDGTTKGRIEMALDAATGRGDFKSACRHAINLGSYLNSTNQLSVADMKKIGKACSAIR